MLIASIIRVISISRFICIFTTTQNRYTDSDETYIKIRNEIGRFHFSYVHCIVVWLEFLTAVFIKCNQARNHKRDRLQIMEREQIWHSLTFWYANVWPLKRHRVQEGWFPHPLLCLFFLEISRAKIMWWVVIVYFECLCTSRPKYYIVAF
jgi:hypothetical protein